MLAAEILWERWPDMGDAGNIIARKLVPIQALMLLDRPPKFRRLPIPRATAALDFLAPSQPAVAHRAVLLVVSWARILYDPRAFCGR